MSLLNAWAVGFRLQASAVGRKPPSGVGARVTAAALVAVGELSGGGVSPGGGGVSPGGGVLAGSVGWGVLSSPGVAEASEVGVREGTVWALS